MVRIILTGLVLLLVIAVAWLLFPREAAEAVVADTSGPGAVPVASPAVREHQPIPPAEPIRHAPDASPQVASIAAARDGKHLERLSPLVAPAPFDAEAFARDPKPYLETVEPGRIQQTAVPSEGATRLRIVGDPRPLLAPGATMPVRVQGVPLAPVSFLAVGGGTFVENGLNAITVRADAEGTASVTFRADPGTVGDAPIVAASPLAVGQQSIIPHVGDAAMVRRMPPGGVQPPATAAASATTASAASATGAAIAR